MGPWVSYFSSACPGSLPFWTHLAIATSFPTWCMEQCKQMLRSWWLTSAISRPVQWIFMDFPSAGVSFADHQLQLLVDSQASCSYVCGCVWIHPDTTQKFEPQSWNIHFSWGLQVSTTAVLNIAVNSLHQAGFDRGGQTKEHLQLAGMPRCPPRA